MKSITILILFEIFILFSICRAYSRKFPNTKCTVYQAKCLFEVVFVPTGCYSYEKAFLQNLIMRKISKFLNPNFKFQNLCLF